eukprot:2817773-Prymnesium_polylepis.1
MGHMMGRGVPHADGRFGHVGLQRVIERPQHLLDALRIRTHPPLDERTPLERRRLPNKRARGGVAAQWVGTSSNVPLNRTARQPRAPPNPGCGCCGGPRLFRGYRDHKARLKVRVGARALPAAPRGSRSARGCAAAACRGRWSRPRRSVPAAPAATRASPGGRACPPRDPAGGTAAAGHHSHTHAPVCQTGSSCGGHRGGGAPQSHACARVPDGQRRHTCGQQSGAAWAHAA